MNSIYKKLIDFLYECGKEIKSNSNLSSVVSSKDKDIKLLADIHLNDRITSFLEKNSSFKILSEEGVDNKNYIEYNEPIWILDPLDGSYNYSRKIPFYCISISLWNINKSDFSCIYNIDNNQMFISYEDKSTLNGVRLKVSNRRKISDSVMCTGFPSFSNYSSDYLEKFIKNIQKWKKIRAIGSAALSLTWVACGIVDAYYEKNIRIWDVAAGLHLVKLAGGNVEVINHKNNFTTVLATNDKIPLSDFKVIK